MLPSLQVLNDGACAVGAGPGRCISGPVHVGRGHGSRGHQPHTETQEKGGNTGLVTFSFLMESINCILYTINSKFLKKDEENNLCTFAFFV